MTFQRIENTKHKSKAFSPLQSHVGKQLKVTHRHTDTQTMSGTEPRVATSRWKAWWPQPFPGPRSTPGVQVSFTTASPRCRFRLALHDTSVGCMSRCQFFSNVRERDSERCRWTCLCFRADHEALPGQLAGAPGLPDGVAGRDAFNGAWSTSLCNAGGALSSRERNSSSDPSQDVQS